MHHGTTPPPLLHAALDAAARGWHVFPLVPGQKRPAIRSWESRATTEPERISRCWEADAFNIGLACGPSGLVVLDLDVPKAPTADDSDRRTGAQSLRELAECRRQQLPDRTYEVRTASGGSHLYYRGPAEGTLRNTAGRLGCRIDTRAHGGYVVAPGSRISAATYETVTEEGVAALPAWLADLLRPAPLPPQQTVDVRLLAYRHGAYLRSALAGEWERVARSTVGRRNDALYEASVALGQLVAGAELSEDEVTTWLGEAARRVGLAEADIRRTIASGLRAGAKRPRTLSGRGTRGMGGESA